MRTRRWLGDADRARSRRVVRTGDDLLCGPVGGRRSLLPRPRPWGAAWHLRM